MNWRRATIISSARGIEPALYEVSPEERKSLLQQILNGLGFAAQAAACVMI